MTDVLRTLGLRRTPQAERADARQERNAAGGYAFTLDDAARLRRFLVLGADVSTYYTSDRALARENAEVVTRMAQAEPVTGLTATALSIADPADPGMLDVVGFDAAVQTLITEFARGL